jgi:8-oxo-dGTP pyrophosphatase MutT (NUDIX family)
VDRPDGRLLGSAPGTIPDLLGRFSVESPPTSLAGAAVLILLRDGAYEVETLLIERTERETDPASGQVAFPGGRVDPSDPSLLATVLRETEEEVGLGPDDLAGPPRFVRTYRASRFGLDVAAFAAALGESGRRPRPRSRQEVAHVFWLPRSSVGTTARVLRETSAGPSEVDATLYEGHVLWGFTRRLLRDFFGHPEAAQPSDPATPDPNRNTTL